MKTLLKKISPPSGSMLFFLLLFLYGLVNNLSFSYMGNTNTRFQEYIIDNFLSDIVLFILKIFSVYMLIGLAIGIAVHLFTLSVSKITGRNIGRRAAFILNICGSLIIFMISFARDIVLYPQVYMNNFYNKHDINKLLVDFLTGHVNPDVLFAVQIIIIVMIFTACIAALFKKRRKTANIISCGIIIIILIYMIINLADAPLKQDEKRPNVLILSSDALRPDHFSGYGYPKDTTPNIDKLIAEGASFRNAFTEVPRTFPAWVSILTGQFSATHGIRHMFPTSRDLNRDFKSIVKILKEKGYRSSVVADYAGDIFSRIDLGFDDVDAPYFNFNYVLQQAIIESHTFLLPFLTGRAGLAAFPVLKDWAYFCPAGFVKDRVIDSINKGGPFFIATFFSSTHFPYAAPYPYYKQFTDKTYSGSYKYYKQRVAIEDTPVSETDIKQINGLYDGCLRAFDDAVGEILYFLSEKKIMDNTIIIILSDHGENLYENDLGMGHGEHFRGMYSIRVPFIIRYPGTISGTKDIHEITRHVDVAPTLLSILNMPVPEYMEGESLMPLIKGTALKKLCAFGETGIWFDNTLRDDLFFQRQRIMYPDITGIAETDSNFGNQIVLKDEYRDLVNLAKHRYVFDGRYKLIYMPMRDKISYELYDTVKNPQEKNNIADSDIINFFRLKKILFEWAGRNGDVIIKRDYIYPRMRY